MEAVVEPAIVQSKHRPRIAERTKQAVIAAYATSGSIIQTAQAFGVHRHTVRRILLSVRQDTRTGLSADWKQRTKQRAIAAVDSALECKTDLYKAGELGNKVLVGLGEFKAGQEVSVGLAIANVPPEWADRYVSLQPASRVEGAAVAELKPDESTT